MSLLNFVRAVRQMSDGPMARPVKLRWQLQSFLDKENVGACFGVFRSFDDARAWLPRSEEFDHAALAAEYVDIRAKRIFAYDYPVMWWLERAFEDGACTVLDLGGSVGVHYYGYRRYLEMPAKLAWRVVEVPSMVGVGQALAIAKGASALAFTDDMRQALMATPSDIWNASGALQYLEDARPGSLLRQCVVRPRHILLNKLPLYGGEDFVTTQNLGDGRFAPVHVYNRRRFIEDIEQFGYTLWDRWDVPERSLYLPGHPEKTIPGFTGLYFVDSATLPPSSRTPPYRLPVGA